MSFHNNANLTLVFQICEKEYLRDLIPLTANSLYEVQTTIDSFLLLFELNPLSTCIDVLPVLFNTLLELPFLSARTFLFTASLADCLLLEGVCPHIHTKKDNNSPTGYFYREKCITGSLSLCISVKIKSILQLIISQ